MSFATQLKTGLDVIIAEFVRGQLVQRFRSARQFFERGGLAGKIVLVS